MYVYVCMYVCTYIHIYLRTYVCTYMYICILVYVYVCMYLQYVTFLIAYVDEPLDLLVDYFKKFGHKPCCFDDTHVFITKLLTTTDADKVGVAPLVRCKLDVNILSNCVFYWNIILGTIIIRDYVMLVDILI